MEEHQFHNQNQSPPDHIEELGSVSQSSLSSSFDPNLRNPDENDDADDEIAMRIICEELRNLVLDQALLNEEREKEDEEEENGNTKGNEVVNDDGSVQIISEERRNLVLDQALLNIESDKEDLYNEESQNGNINENELVNDYGWGDYGGDNYDYEGDRYGGGNTSENENGYDEGFSKEGGFNDENSIMRKFNHPLRPDAQDCSYFMKTGMCKFGSNCKFNHPYRKKNQAFPSPLQHGTKERGKQKEENEERPGQIECKYYLTSGGCKYGKACKFAHGRDKSSVSPITEFNFLGLPIRPGERECPYYMRTGSCKYGSNCRFHHPDPTDVAGANPSSGFKNAGGIPVRSASHPAVSSWSPPRTSNDSAPYVPTIYPPTQGIASPNSEWGGYQAPVYPTSEKRLPTPPAIALSNPANKNNFYPRPQQPLLPVGEYPERPGQPECSYFIKTGDCKYKSSCKFHHPKYRISKANILNDKGLPLRPDQSVCSYYSRYGICKFGPACRFDHPENYGRSLIHQELEVDLGWGGQELQVDH